MATFAGSPEAGSELKLIDMSQEDRDNLLSTIVYVDKPRAYVLSDHAIVALDDAIECFYEANTIWNYSQIFNSLNGKGKQCFPNVADLRTGDRVMLGNGRGYPDFMVVWLAKNLNDVPNESMAYVMDALNRNDEGEDEAPHLATEFRDIAFDEHENQCFTVPRTADGFHNDDNHHCYFFPPVDEMKSVLSPAHSSAPVNYLGGLIAIIDPVLAHSQSFFGKIIAETKRSERWAAVEDFPLKYHGCHMGQDHNGVPVAYRLTWNSNSNLADYETYLDDCRTMFEAHFRAECGAYNVLK
jgi:hypothetical protein